MVQVLDCLFQAASPSRRKGKRGMLWFPEEILSQGRCSKACVIFFIKELLRVHHVVLNYFLCMSFLQCCRGIQQGVDLNGVSVIHWNQQRPPLTPTLELLPVPADAVAPLATVQSHLLALPAPDLRFPAQRPGWAARIWYSGSRCGHCPPSQELVKDANARKDSVHTFGAPSTT